MQKSGSFLIRYFPPLFLCGSLFVLYLQTMAPGLTWANGGSDGGDLIAAAATGGIAHPTGYPLYLLLARLFQYAPVGSLAFRTNLMSAVFMSLAAAMVYGLVAQAITFSQRMTKILSALAAGYAFGLAPLIWSQSVITEVYALQSFLIMLIIYLFSYPVMSFGGSPARIDYLRGLSLGLAVSNHITAVFILPMTLVAGSVYSSVSVPGNSNQADSWFRNLKFDLRLLRRQCFGLVIGLFPYAFLPLKALAHPPVNWGNPITLKNFWWLVSGQLYQSYYLEFSFLESWEHAQTAAALLFRQFGSAGVLLGVLGLALFGQRSRLYALTVWIAAMYAAFAFLYRAEDSHLFLIPVFGCFAIWTGLGVVGIARRFGERAFLPRAVFQLLCLGYLILRPLTAIDEVDASQDHRAESFGAEILSTVPQNAIIFADGDHAVFSLWYFHFALGERPDVMVIAVDLLHFDWYQENLRSTYPSLVLAGPFPWPETIIQDNGQRATCYVQYTDHTIMDCSNHVDSP